MKLRTFFLFFLVGIVGITFITSIVLTNQGITAEKNDKILLIQHEANSFALSMSTDLNERIADTRFLADTNGVVASDMPIEFKRAFLTEFTQTYTDYDSVSVYDKNGLKILDTRNLGIGDDISDTPFFKKTVELGMFYDKTPANLSLSDRTDLTNHLSILRIGHAIFDTNDVCIGIIITNYSLSYLFDTVVAISNPEYLYELSAFSDTNDVIWNISTGHIDTDGLHYDVDTVLETSNHIVVNSNLPTVKNFDSGEEIFVFVSANPSIILNDLIQKEIILYGVVTTTTVISISLIMYFMRKLDSEIDHVDSQLQRLPKSQSLDKKSLFFEDISKIQSKILSSNELLIKEKKKNSEKLDFFEDLTLFCKNISAGDYSKKIKNGHYTATEIHTVQKNVNNMLSELNKLELDRNSFSAMITHELKTPLVPIMGYVQLLQKGKLGSLTDSQQDAIDEILRSSKTLYTLIENILTVQKLNSATSQLNYTSTTSTRLLDAVYNKMAPAMESKNIEFSVEQPLSFSLRVDVDKIIEVFVNLIQNSVDFVSPNSGKITISSTLDGDNFLFSVVDNGIGVSLSDQKKLFTKFYQVDTSATRRHGGTGLGLAICKGIITSMGGNIWVKSEPNVRTGFYFSIPSNPN